MHDGNKEEEGLVDFKKGLEQYEKGLVDEETILKELFELLKTEVIDQLLVADNPSSREQVLKILQDQVKHVIEVGKRIGYRPLIRIFEDEEQLIEQVDDLVKKFPGTSLAESPDIRSTLLRMKDMIREQQGMIFSHEKFVQKEKKKLIEILKGVSDLKSEYVEDHSLTPNLARENEYE